MPGIQDAYRPYPAPTSPHIMHQSWYDLLFAHWCIPAAEMRRVVPTALPLDTFEGTAFIGVVPFMMRNVHPRLVPTLPWLSTFPELNVRTYVILDGRPGVYFFSLDAANPVAVELARVLFHLPYENATMQCRVTNVTPYGNEIEYGSTRTDKRGASAFLRAVYGPTGEAFIAEPGSLEYFLTARYCLYTLDPQGNVLRAEIHHSPWPLQPAHAEFETNTMTQQIPLALPAGAPHLLYARALDVVVWLPKLVKPELASRIG